MKISCFAVGLAALLATGAARADVIFDNITGNPSQGTYVLGAGNIGSPLGNSFAVTAPATLTSVSLTLADANGADGGYILVYLVPDAAGIPASTGRVLANSKILLGSIFDSALTGVVSTQILITNQSVSAGTWWIELVNSADTANGGNGVFSGAVWSYLLGNAGIGTAGQSFSYTNAANTAIVSDPNTKGPFRIMINANAASQASVPEPVGMAVLGAALAGLGFARRRRCGRAGTRSDR